MAVRILRRLGEDDVADPLSRLFCFPHAGAGAAIFRAWPLRLPLEVEVACPCLPGRDALAGEPPMAQMPPLVARLADAVAKLLDRPYGLFGHSMGAFVDFDLAREIARRGLPPPTRLLVSAQRAPSLPYPLAPIFQLPDDEFLAAVRRRYNAIPPSIMAQKDVLAFVLKVLRADYTLVEDYHYAVGAPLVCPIVVLRGRDDPSIGRDQLAGWADETSAGCRFHEMPGGHFFPQSHQAELLAVLRAELACQLPARAGK